MITLTAKINLLSGDNKALSLGSDNLSGNNISSDLSKVVGGKTKGSNPFIIGASKIGDGSTFSGVVDYFIGTQVSNDNGFFQNPYKIKIKSEKSIKSLTISFDKLNGRYPKKILLSEIIPQESGGIIDTKIEQKKANLFEQDGFLYAWVAYFDCPIPPESTSVSITIPSGEDISVDENSYPPEVSYENGKIKVSFVTIGLRENYYYNVNLTYSYRAIEKNTIFEDNDAIFTILLENSTNEFLLTIEDWNTAKSTMIITGIYAEVVITIDRKNIISLESSIFDRSDVKLPSFGVISNTGNIEFNDLDGEIRDYAEQLLLQSGLSCEIRLNNTLVDGASELVAKMETDQWDYDNDNRVVSVSIKDDLEEWQDINVVGIAYDPREIVGKPFSWLYEHLWAITNPNYPMKKLEDLDEETNVVLTTSFIQYPLLESGSLWQQWTKLCQACQLHIYKNSDGIVVCRYNGGN